MATRAQVRPITARRKPLRSASARAISTAEDPGAPAGIRERPARRSPPSSGPVLLVANLFHPIDRLAVERLRDGDVAHRRGVRGAVPMLLAGREPDHVAGADLLAPAALDLCPADARRHD